MSEHTSPAGPKPPSVDRLSLLWHRINDHKIVQWSVAYVALTYGIQHAVVLTREAFEWPQAVERISMLLFALGLPVVMTFAWYHGERASRQFTKAELSILSALLVIGSLLFYGFVRPSEEGSSGTKPIVQQAGVANARVPSIPTEGPISIAVLPFVNLSSDKEQEFFSDGMTEEITSALAKVPGLTVIGRTSAFEFKGQNKDLRAIGQALGTTHLIEGSVRKAGTRVRITAQLIIADSGAHLWTENYDRELTDIFAVQEDIAQAIAGALRVPLGLKPGETLITNRIADPKLYEQYLRGRAQLRTRNWTAMFDTLEDLVAHAPAFAPGWATLADGYRAATNPALRSGDYKTVALLQDKAEAAARKAIQLDASYAGGYSELAATLARRGKWAKAEDLYKQAFILDPNDPEMLQNYSGTVFDSGHLKEALRLRERLHALEPLVPLYNTITARFMQANGQIDASIPILERGTGANTGGERNGDLAEAYAINGRFAEAADTLLLITNQINRHSVEDAARLLRSAPSKTAAPAKLPTLDAELGFVYAYIGAPERMLEYPEKGIKEGNLGPITVVWRPSYAPARKTERFKALIRKAGLIDYWRGRGWPDLCRPMGTDDFVCD